ncbi:MAG: hypothetical protein EAY70_00510 [Sphingomonadales bacterium]|nr:MAG: hypothetical protein EAY70_00510 [Sphingomonadales bacterium]
MINPRELWTTGLEIARSRAVHIALMLVIPYACVLVGLDVAAHYGDVTGAALPVQFFMSQDGSFAEFLEYALTSAAAVLLFVVWRRTRAMVYLTSAMLFVWMTLDNWGEVHEQLGFVFAADMPIFAAVPLHPNHLAETLVFGLIGLAWLAGMVAALRQADRRAAIHGVLIAMCIAGAAVFGVAVDMVTSWGEHTVRVTNLLAFIEDEGEFVMIIAMFALSVGIFDVEARRHGSDTRVYGGLRTTSA